MASYRDIYYGYSYSYMCNKEKHISHLMINIMIFSSFEIPLKWVLIMEWWMRVNYVNNLNFEMNRGLIANRRESHVVEFITTRCVANLG